MCSAMRICFVHTLSLTQTHNGVVSDTDKHAEALELTRFNA